MIEINSEGHITNVKWGDATHLMYYRVGNTWIRARWPVISAIKNQGRKLEEGR
jgi:hypothetical protein